MTCPKCGSTNVQMQTFQEQQGSRTKTKFRFKAGEKRHGFFWWLFIGGWGWMIEFMLWFVCTPFMLIVKLFYHPKKYKGSGKSVSTTRNKIGYATLYTCQDCGKQWKHMA